MDYRELKYIDSLNHFKSITHAANYVGISQPSMSKFIIQYEDKIGFKIFNKIGKKLVTTPEGEIYLKLCSEVLLKQIQLENMAKDFAAKNTGAIVLGITPARGRYILPNILPAFREKYPAYKIKIIEGNVTEIEQYLEKGIVNIALLIVDDKEYPNLILEEINMEEVLLCTNPNSILSNKAVWKQGFRHKWVDISQLKNEFFILPNHSSRLAPFAEDIFSEYNFYPEHIRTSNIDSNINMVAQGMGSCFATEISIKYCNPIGKPMYFSVGKYPRYTKFVAAYHKDAYISDAAKYLIEINKDIFG